MLVLILKMLVVLLRMLGKMLVGALKMLAVIMKMTLNLLVSILRISVGSFLPARSLDVSPTSKDNYDVFLSFRGEDMRNIFTGHLYKYLDQKGINTFIDDKLKRGHEISDSLLRTIEGSKMSIIVFSKDYASSTWCLEELSKIMECSKSRGQMVLSLFYNVDPSEVRKQTGRYGQALTKHEKKLGKSKVDNWRKALTKAANLSGRHLANGHEANFLQKVVEEVSSMMKHKKLHVAEYPVGISSRVRALEPLLSVGSNDHRMVGICGTSGIGKTTLAKAVYNLTEDRFNGSVFLKDVRDTKISDVVKLQQKLLREVLHDKKLELGNCDEGIETIKDRLKNKRVLIVIDDVDHVEYLKKLVGGVEWFGAGSRVIITTTNKHLLVQHGLEREFIYVVVELSYAKAYKLLTWHAFKKTALTDDYKKLAEDVVEYCDGLPLALTILGAHLCDRSIKEWMGELKKLERIPPHDVYAKLKISYDGLDQFQKDIFLDIAFFFNGQETSYVEDILARCNFYPDIGIPVLKDKFLISAGTHLRMHSLLQELGKAIVFLESPKEPGRRTRLWFLDDIIQVLKNGTGTNTIEGIILDLPERMEVQVSADAFKNMNRLRVLIIHNAVFPVCPNYLSNELKLLDWPSYSSETLPHDFHPVEIVSVNLSRSNINTLGNAFENVRFLKSMDFSFCKYLREIPDLSTAQNLRTLICKRCENLSDIHDSVGFLSKLYELNLEACCNLGSLPSYLKLNSLFELNLSGCSKLEKFPSQVEMKRLQKLNLGRTTIKEPPQFIKYISGLDDLDLSYCPNLTHLGSTISNLKRLFRLSVQGCGMLKEIVDLPCTVQVVSASNCVSLERFSQFPSDCNEFLDGLYSFENCQQLSDGILPLNVENFFLKFVHGFFEYPGSEIPKCVAHKRKISWEGGPYQRKQSFSLFLPFHLYEKVKSIALCFVLGPDKSQPWTASSVVSVKIYEETMCQLGFEGLKSDHVLILLYACENIRGQNGRRGVYLNFSLILHAGEYVKLKECGVHLILFRGNGEGKVMQQYLSRLKRYLHATALKVLGMSYDETVEWKDDDYVEDFGSGNENTLKLAWRLGWTLARQILKWYCWVISRFWFCLLFSSFLMLRGKLFLFCLVIFMLVGSVY